MEDVSSTYIEVEVVAEGLGEWPSPTNCTGCRVVIFIAIPDTKTLLDFPVKGTCLRATSAARVEQTV